MAVDRARRQLARAIGGGSSGETRSDPALWLRAVLAGYPDRVARRRGGGSARARMVGGSGIALDPESVVREAEFFVAVELEAGARAESADARVRVASAIEPEWLAETFPAAVRQVEEAVFDEAGERVIRRATRLYLDLPVHESVRPEVDPEIAEPILAAAARRDPARALSLGAAEQALLDRIGFLARLVPELGLPADPGPLLAALVSAVAPGSRSFADLRRADLAAAIRALLGAEQRRALESEAPAEFRLPSGRQADIRYERGRPPLVAARIQELFGLSTTPRLARGRVALAIEILAPSRRPVQVTDDLASFWARTYPEVRKQLRGRYPKHAWPESPTTFVSPSPGRGKRSG
jgi:ATP-dependent helicase HrpB